MELFNYVIYEGCRNGMHPVFLYYMLDNDFKSCQYDTWFEDLEIAKQTAFEEYGILESDWAPYEE